MPEPPRPARRRDADLPDDRRPRPTPDEPTPTSAVEAPEAAAGPAADAARRPAADHRHRGRRWPRRARALAAGTGPVAIDAERASGYRYSSRAYLIQLRREGAGTCLVDPIALRLAGAAAGGARAAPSGSCTPPPRTCPACAEVGLRPGRALRHRARRPAAGLPAGRPGHAGRDAARLPDEEGALRRRLVDAGRCPSRGWSTPPSTSRCSSSCATCSAAELVEAGKDEWARQEFDAPARLRARRPRAEPWRRTSGLHRVRGRRALGAVRALWEARDEIAAASATSRPGRIIPDSAIVAAALAMPDDRGALLATKGFHGRGAERYAAPLGRRAARGRATCPRPSCPSRAPRTDGPPLAARLGRARPGRRPPAAAGPRGDRRAGRGAPGCRSRTCSPPTTCAGCCGRRRRPGSPTRWPTRSPPQLRELRRPRLAGRARRARRSPTPIARGGAAARPEPAGARPTGLGRQSADGVVARVGVGVLGRRGSAATPRRSAR